MKPDPYVLAILGTVVVASLFPCHGEAARIANAATGLVVGALFFLYGARLSRESIVQGLANVRLQAVVLVATFVLFPLLGIAFRALLAPWMTASLLAGIVFLTVLPSTVQSSIAFTSVARGNIPAAICAASISNVAGVVITPILAQILVGGASGTGGGPEASPFANLGHIALNLLAPFAVGHLLRRWLEAPLARHKAVLGLLDRGSILGIVYVAFSEGVVNGIWHTLPVASFVLLGVVCSVLLAIVMVATTLVSRRMKVPTEDEIAIVFCGSKKSLASGLAMAKVIFSGPQVSVMILPLMVFHQIQLMVCAVLAGRYAARRPNP